MKVVSKYSTMAFGVQFVMITGNYQRPTWSVASWDSMELCWHFVLLLMDKEKG